MADKPIENVLSEAEHASKKTQPAIQPKGTVQKKHRFIKGDAKIVVPYILENVVVPGLASFAENTIINFIHFMFNGNPNGNNGGVYVNNRINYSGFSNNRVGGNQGYINAGGRVNNLGYDRILFQSEQEANIVKDRLYETLTRQGYVTVAQLFDYAGAQSEIKSTYNNYGWDDLTGTIVVSNGHGWEIKLPNPKAIAL